MLLSSINRMFVSSWGGGHSELGRTVQLISSSEEAGGAGVSVDSLDSSLSQQRQQ